MIVLAVSFTLVLIVAATATSYSEGLAAMAANMPGRGIDILSTFLLMLVFVFFLLASRDPHQVRNYVYARIAHDVRRYLLTTTALSAIMGIIVGVARSSPHCCNCTLLRSCWPSVSGGLVRGIIGAMPAVPLTAIICLVALRIDSLRPLANLIGGRIPDIETR